MKSLNKVQLIGWLGKEPQIITIKDGTFMAAMNMATDIYIPQNGREPKIITTWHRVKLWRQKQIEYCRSSLTRGSHVLVDGRIQYRQYSDRHGVTRTSVEIIANYIIDLDR